MPLGDNETPQGSHRDRNKIAISTVPLPPFKCPLYADTHVYCMYTTHDLNSLAIYALTNLEMRLDQITFWCTFRGPAKSPLTPVNFKMERVEKGLKGFYPHPGFLELVL